jgi:hypothetical protein
MVTAMPAATTATAISCSVRQQRTLTSSSVTFFDIVQKNWLYSSKLKKREAGLKLDDRAKATQSRTRTLMHLIISWFWAVLRGLKRCRSFLRSGR